jgi:hypothetical protein
MSVSRHDDVWRNRGIDPRILNRETRLRRVLSDLVSPCTQLVREEPLAAETWRRPRECSIEQQTERFSSL